MRTFLILIFTLCFLVSYAQTIPKSPNKKKGKSGIREGKWTLMYDDKGMETLDEKSAKYYSLRNYKKGLIVGKIKTFYLNGNPQMEADSVFKTDPEQYHGLVTYFYEDGSVSDYKVFNAGKLDISQTLEKVTKLAAEKKENPGPKSPSYYRCLSNLISLYRMQGKLLQAEPLMREAHDIIREMRGEKHPAYATSLYNLAGIYRDLGSYGQAEPLYKQSLLLRKEAAGKSSLETATVLNDLAGLYSFTGSYGPAEMNFRQAIEIRKEKSGDKKTGLATSLNDLATLYEKMGNYEQAEKLYLQAGDLFKSENQIDYAKVLNNLANLYQTIGFYNKASDLFSQSLSILKSDVGEKSLPYVTTLSNLGKMNSKTGRYQEAETYYQQALDLKKEFLGEKTLSYANTLFQMGILKNNKGEFTQAIEIYQKVLQSQKELLGEKHPDYAQTLRMLAKSLFLSGNKKQAELYFLQVNQNATYQIENYFPFFTEREKEEFYNNKIKFNFEEFNSFALARSNENPEMLGEMYNNQLLTKALLLNASNKWKQRIKNSGDMKLIREFDDWQTQKAYITKLYHDKEKAPDVKLLDSLENRVNTLERGLSQRSENFAKIKEKKLTWQQVQAKLLPNEAAVEVIRFRKFGQDKIVTDSSSTAKNKYKNYGLTDTVYYAALVVTKATRRNPTLVLFENGAELEAKFYNNYRNSVKTKKTDELSYNKFWAPIAKKLTGITKVYFSPDGVFNQVSLNTLLNPQTKKFVIDELEVQMVTNSKDLLVIHPKDEMNYLALLFGAPNFGLDESQREKAVEKERSASRVQSYYTLSVERGSYSLVDLPGTKVEIESISQLLSEKGYTLQVYLGDEALEENLKENYKPRLLHIATHGFFDPDLNQNEEDKFLRNPLLRSGLLLAGSGYTLNNISKPKEGEKENLDDGILTAYEAMNLNLDNTDMVLLSACETGLGELKNGEGVYGLQRAFKVAGARTIVMSLWSVNDQTTQELMFSFYKNWLNTNDKHRAFKAAQLEIKKKYKEPYFWGAFVMVGD